VHRHHQRFAQHFGAEQDVGRTVIGVDEVSPAQMAQQCAAAALAEMGIEAKIDATRTQGGLDVEAGDDLENHALFEVGLTSHRIGDGDGKQLHAADDALAGECDE
jgi:hypothetical protein